MQVNMMVRMLLLSLILFSSSAALSAQERVRDKQGRVIAILEPVPNGITKIKSPSGKTLGYYSSKTNKTYYVNGKFFGPGNQLLLLIDRP